MPNNPTISKITLPTGTTYEIKDAQARADIASITNIQSGITFLGVTTTELTDEAPTSSIIVNGESVNAQVGNLVFYGKKEFVFDGARWRQLGDLSGLGNLAFKDSALGSYTPAGSISEITFTGTPTSISGTFTPSGLINISQNSAQNKNVNYTPSGEISTPSFTGAPLTVTITNDISGTIQVSTSETGAANYTPKGLVSAPDIVLKSNGAGATLPIKCIDTVGTLPSFSCNVQDEVLQLSWSEGSLPSTTTRNLKIGDPSYQLASNPIFDGNAVNISATFSGDTFSGSTTVTPEGSISTPSFVGEGVELKAIFDGNSSDFQINNFTPEGTISTPSFIGTEGVVTVS